MKKLLIAFTILPFLGAPAFAQAAPDPDDMLTPTERGLNRNSDVNPDWTWMTEGQAAKILKAGGYDVVLSLEKSGAFWRGKAIRNNESYHVAVNRYCEVFGHLDHKSLALRALIAAEPKVAKPTKTMLATLNGNVAVSVSRAAPPTLTPSAVKTVMGEAGWTWMTEDQAVRLLKAKGYDNIHSLKRDEQGIWRAQALKADVALRVGVDIYGNTEDQPDSQGVAVAALGG
jgi:hypothetical protein